MARSTKRPIMIHIKDEMNLELRKSKPAPKTKAKSMDKKIIHLAACRSVYIPAEMSPKNEILLIILGERGKQMFRVYGLES